MMGVTGEFEFAEVERMFDDGDGDGPAGEGVQYWKWRQLQKKKNCTDAKKKQQKRNKKSLNDFLIVPLDVTDDEAEILHVHSGNLYRKLHENYAKLS